MAKVYSGRLKVATAHAQLKPRFDCTWLSTSG